MFVFMLPTIEERAQQHKGTPAQCAYFSRRRHAGIVWAECDSRRRARHTYRMLSSHALIAFSLRVSACLTAHLPEGGTKARNCAARILFKKRVECGMRAPFLSGRGALHLTLHAKPQVTKYETWGFLSEYPFESM